MKLNITPLTKILLLFFAVPCFSQGGSDFFKSSLWVKSAPDSAATSQQFNFNPIIDFGKNDFEREYKRLILKETTLFTVFKSEAKSEVSIMSIIRGVQTTKFTNREIIADKKFQYEHGNPAQGVLVSYRNNNNAFPVNKKGSLVFEPALFDQQTGENQIMELICLPRFAKTATKNIAESYLSMKYGISLKEGKDYVNSAGDTIWHYKDNGSYGKRVTAIGRDDATGLHQKQSHNSEKDGLCLSLGKLARSNAKNPSEISDRSFLLWSDNDGKTDFDAKTGELKKIKRVWQVLSASGEDKKDFDTQLTIDKKLLFPKEPQDPGNIDYIWMAIDTAGATTFEYASARYIKQLERPGDSLFYPGISWKSGQTAKFTFIKAPDFFLVTDVTAETCQGVSGNAVVTAIGGRAPYRMQLRNEAGVLQQYPSADGKLTIDNLKSGNYTLEAVDSFGKTALITFSTEPFSEQQISLASTAYITNDGSATIAPAGNMQGLTYTWTYDGKVISDQRVLQVSQTGKYLLEVTSADGCRKSFITEVVGSSSGANGDWTVYPNPAGVSQHFHVRLSFSEPVVTSVAITDVSGKVLLNKDLGIVDHYEFTESLLTAGTYFVRITKAGVVETGKLIIK